MMNYIPQINDFDCGIAAVKMMLAYLHDDDNYLYLPFKEKGGPYSYQELIEYAAKENVTLTGFRVEEKEELLKNDVFPIIVTINPKEGANHAVLVHKINRRYVYYIDPDGGKKKMKVHQFIEIFDGTGLILDTYKKKKCDYQIEDRISKKDCVLSIIYQILSGVFCVLGIYFINSNSYIFVPIILLAVSVLFEILLRTHLLKAMKKMDSLYFDEIKLNKEQYNDFYVRYQNFKKLSWVNPLELILVLFVSSFLVFITIINGVNHIFLIIVPVLLSLADYFYYLPWQKEKEKDVAIEEKQLDNAEDILLYRQEIESLNQKAYNYAQIALFKKYLFIFLMIITSILVVALNHVLSVTYVAFYLFIELALYQNFDKILLYKKKNEEYLKSKVSVLNIVHQNDEID